MENKIKNAAEEYMMGIADSHIFGAEFRWNDMKAAFEAGVKWKEKQDARIWNSTRSSVPEGKKQVLSFEDDGYFHLGTEPHPDSVEWCFAKDLLPK